MYILNIYIDTHTFWASIYVVNLNMCIYNYIYIHTRFFLKYAEFLIQMSVYITIYH